MSAETRTEHQVVESVTGAATRTEQTDTNQTDTNQNKQIAKRFYALFSAGDIAGALDLLSDDVAFWLPGKPELLPSAGTYTKERLAKLFARMTSRLKNGLTLTVKGVLAEGDRVAIELESFGELDNGREYRNEYHALVRISDGLIREVREYHDTQHVHAVWFLP